MSSKTGWFIVDAAGKEHGPFSGPQLVEAAKKSKLTNKCKVRHEELTKNKLVQPDAIRQIKEVMDSMPPPPTKAVPAVLEAEPYDPEAEMIASAKKSVSAIARGVTSIASSAANAATSLSRQQPGLEPTGEASLSNFVADGQDAAMVAKLLSRVHEICTSKEEVLYAAVQQRPVANFCPDGIVLTNRRFIVFVQKVLGRFEFHDYVWRDLKDAHMKEDIMGATISVQAKKEKISMGWLPKAQAKKVYRIAQEQEEEIFHAERELMLEEKRAGASQTVVNTAVQAAPAPAQPAADPLTKLQQLKQMLDADLITQDEFDAKKKELLSQM